MDRPVRVWRLRVFYPLGSLEPGWEPEGWDNPQWHHLDDPPQFTWPRNRNYLSEPGAVGRAKLLGQYGAEVIVEASNIVEWD